MTDDGEPVTVGALLAEAVAALVDAGVPSPRPDAETLVSHVLDRPRGRLWLDRDEPVSPAEMNGLRGLVARRAERVPLQHLTGVAGFRHVTLEVGAGCFVPRPETELLAGWAVESAGGLVRSGRRPRVVDVGTGSGAIAASVAHEVERAQVVAVELDPAAYAWAERNLVHRGVELRLGDAAVVLDDLAGTVDVLVSNPPYIPLEAWESVDPEARDHDPSLALWSGADGLDAVRMLESLGRRLLRPGGVIGVEHAAAQGDSAPGVFTRSETSPWTGVRDHADLAGRPRYLTARLRG